MHAALGKRKRAIKHVCTVTFKVCMRIPGSVSLSCKSVADINYLHSILKLFLQSSIFDAAKVFRWYFLSLRCWKHFSGLVSLIPKCKISKVRWQCSAFQICLFAYAVSHKRAAACRGRVYILSGRNQAKTNSPPKIHMLLQWRRTCRPDAVFWNATLSLDTFVAAVLQQAADQANDAMQC